MDEPRVVAKERVIGRLEREQTWERPEHLLIATTPLIAD